jgi:hypothetical protein
VREIPLHGGNVTAGVVRVGDTVRRPTGRWTPAVHALLRHLESVGFAGAPRALGIDETGREMLSYIEGHAAWPWDAFAPLATDDGLVKVAELIGAYHAAAASFAPPPNAAWSEVAPRDGDQIVCHNDLAPWNLILEPGGAWTFVDWDLAAPGTRLSDLAYAARTFVQLSPDCPWEVPIAGRLRLLCEVWRVRPAALIEAIVWRARADFDGLRAHAEAGVAPWRRMWDEGHGAADERITRFIEANAARWLADLS